MILMQVKDFNYCLPPELIAQKPSADRCASRLLTIDRERGVIAESRFAEIVEFLKPGDLLVVNDTRVIPARLHGVKESGGRVEVFLVRKIELPGEVWDCLIRASKPPRSAVCMHFADGMTASVTGRGEGECWRIVFSRAEGFRDWLEREGSMPLPPYIKRQAEIGDRERYQTMFARVEGAVAAPTAGLHFTPELIKLLSERGVDLVSLTLHVGLGTFLPMRVDDVRDHRMHRESYCISEATATAINERRKAGGRVVAVGTTVVRTLEQVVLSDGAVPAGAGEADIFIFPGYKFKVVDALITNFHLPQSTLLMLVSAFAGKQLLFRAYNEAVARKFRFFSYGDAMFIG